MAVTAIWPIKGRVDDAIRYAANPAKTTEKKQRKKPSLFAVDEVIEYAVDETKTEELMYVTGINCTVGNAIRRFKEDLIRCGDKSERVCYHGYQSFAEGEVDAFTAHEIGKKLAERLWGDKYRVVVATHCNTGHYHNHFVICSQPMADGPKFRNSHEDYRRMREESDNLCREYGLSIIERLGDQGRNFGEWKAEQEGKPTLRSVIREAIDIAIKGSVTEKQFLEAMDEMGFIIDQHGKYPKIKQVGSERFVRFRSLGPGYSVEEIIERIGRNENLEYPDIPHQESPRQVFEEETEKPANMDFIAVNRCYFRALKITQKRPATNRRMYFLIRQDHSKMRIYQDQLNLVTEHHLSSASDVLAYKEEAMRDIDSLTETRRGLRNDLKRAQRLEEPDRTVLSSKIRLEIEQCTRSLSKLRREVTSCDEVMARIDRMRENLMRIEQDKFRGREHPVIGFVPEKVSRIQETILSQEQRKEEPKK